MDFWERVARKLGMTDSEVEAVLQTHQELNSAEAQSSGDRKDDQDRGGPAAGDPGGPSSSSSIYVAIHSPIPDTSRGAGPRPSLGPMVGTPEVYIGWRWWRLDYDWNLNSLGHNLVWRGPTARADKVPTENNSSGIYSVRERGDCDSYYQSLGVCGQIEYSGVVVVGESGFRGEVATVRSLYLEQYLISAVNDGFKPNDYVTWPSPEKVKLLEERYQCPVHLEEKRNDDQSFFPRKVISSASTQYIPMSSMGSSIPYSALLSQMQANSINQQMMANYYGPQQSYGTSRALRAGIFPGIVPSLRT